MIHVSQGKGYQFKSITFEMCPVGFVSFINRKTNNPRDYRGPGMRSYQLWKKWAKLTAEERERYRIY